MTAMAEDSTHTQTHAHTCIHYTNMVHACIMNTGTSLCPGPRCSSCDRSCRQVLRTVQEVCEHSVWYTASVYVCTVTVLCKRCLYLWHKINNFPLNALVMFRQASALCLCVPVPCEFCITKFDYRTLRCYNRASM